MNQTITLENWIKTNKEGEKGNNKNVIKLEPTTCEVFEIYNYRWQRHVDRVSATKLEC